MIAQTMFDKLQVVVDDRIRAPVENGAGSLDRDKLKFVGHFGL
jgi:hypothetical protein